MLDKRKIRALIVYSAYFQYARQKLTMSWAKPINFISTGNAIRRMLSLYSIEFWETLLLIFMAVKIFCFSIILEKQKD